MDRRLALLVKFAALDKLTAPMRAMGAGARRTGKDIAGTRQELQQLQRAQSNLKGFRDQEAKLRSTGAKLEDVRKRLERLTAAEEGADAGSKKLARAMENARKTAVALERQFEEEGRALQQLSRRLEATGVDVTDLGRSEQLLERRITDTTRSLQRQREEMARNQRTQQTLSNVQNAGSTVTGLGVGALGAGLAVGVPLKDAVDKAAEYRATMTDIALKTNLSEHETVRLGKAIAAIGPKVAQLPSDLRQGVDQLAGAGLDPQAAVKIIEPIGKAATATRASIEDLANASYAGIDNLKVPVGETARMLDVMTAAGKSGAFELKDMAQYFPALTASAASLGQKGVPAVADLAAALQIARKGAGDSATAANNVQNLLNKINAKDTVDNFKKFGIDLPKQLKKAYKEGKTPLEAITELTNQATKGDMSKLSYLFGDAQVQAALRPLIANLNEYRKIRAAAEQASGTVDQDFARRAGSGELATAKWAATFERLQVIAGTVLLPTLNDLLDAAERWTTSLAAWMDANPELASTIMHVVAGFVAFAIAAGAIGTVLGPAISALGSLGKGFSAVSTFLRNSPRFQAFLTWLGPQLRKLGPAIRTLATRLLPLLGNGFLLLGRSLMSAGAMMLANPVILIIVAIVAAIAVAAYFIWKYWDQIKLAITSNWERIRNILLGAVVIFMPFVAVIMWVVKKIIDNWGRIKGAVMSVVTYMSGILQPIIQPWLAVQAFLAGLVGKFFQFGVDIVGGLIRGIFSMVGTLLKTVAGVAEKVGASFAASLGIKSPSRVFMAHGGHITDGLAIGLDRGAVAPVQRMTRLSGELQSAVAAGSKPFAAGGAAAAGGAGAGAGGGGGAGVTIGTVAISIATQPGQDPNSFAAAVRAEFEKLMAQQAAAQRSRYDDED
ncbi:TP901 family phage tail tape measure protein [Sphingomonas zeicaulis]|uniref:phage tail tape measure protein n=1 Tax=Sphingomonas zeicaulis TaxID=1632740 RepID=UPI003D19FA25